MLNPEKIFNIQSNPEFEAIALEAFHYQSQHVKVYRDFISHLKILPENISDITKIPFLPIELFKSQEIIALNKTPQIIFESSTTTGTTPSKHFVADIKIYEESFLRAFTHFYGDPSNYCILALLPSYLERSGSSLVYMVEKLVQLSGHPDSGFYLNEHEKLISVLRFLKKKGQPTILLGVSFALLDLAEKYEEDLNGVIVMETGGMKGRRKEMVREDLHTLLKNRFNLEQVHSEYGMTELLSQAYSKSEGHFVSPPWVKILIRDSHDPMQVLENGNTGCINIIDLANVYSCSFISSSDLGKLNQDGSFDVLGRIGNSDIRGCNLMIG